MADFFSDSDDDKAVEELLSQAMDSTVLEQVAKINCASFNDSDLPSHLETRFQKLKSFPSNPNSLPSSKSFNKIDSVNEAKNCEEKKGLKKSPDSKICLSPSNSSETCNFSPLKKNPKLKKGFQKSPDSKNCLSPSNSSESCDFSPLKKNPQKKLGGKNEMKSPSSSRSISPPVKSGCFLCSPKRVSRRKSSKEMRGLELGFDWGKNDGFLSDLSNFSMNSSQKKMIKKAMEEEEKICREADKIVKWAKHASARMEVEGIDDELSDDENAKFH
ncbi:hypothetical protein BUALT_Bualt05G0032600 [Buddleja alternifolia]|uniref:Uncharacterized protein n=1 Tax=Buddleja alternifolia TaxID=168488 RepID=A0AAV6XG23_9LAMI|nr:hypothetical protein BUALT_Bualt05G0032600 [Buddleja alternifolia]